MTGKDMLEKIQQLDSDLIEEAEYGSFRRKSVRKAIVLFWRQRWWWGR